MRKDTQGNGHIVRLDVHGYDVISLIGALGILIRENNDNLWELKREPCSHHCLVDTQDKYIAELIKLKGYLEKKRIEKIQLNF